MKRNRKVNGEKIFSIVTACAVVCALVIGALSLIRMGDNAGGGDNVVDLNETRAEAGTQAAQQNEIAYNVEETETEKVEIEYTKAIKETIGAETKAAKENDTQAGMSAEKPDSGIVVGAPKGAIAKYSFSENDTLVWPVKGEVVLKYNMDSTIYFPTLGMYKVNPAMNIASTAGTEVVAAAAGVVESVSTSEETGTTVHIAIGNDYVTTYGLLDNVNLKAGMTVVAGDVLGTVAEPTKYYTKEGANLYFKMTKGEDPVDPALFLAD